MTTISIMYFLNLILWRIFCLHFQFEGLRAMKRQQLVYKAIWEEMRDGGDVHAVDSIVAKTPKEAKEWETSL